MNDQFNLLKEQVDKRITSIDRSRIYYRRVASYASIITAIMAGLSAVLLGLHMPCLAEETRISALIITSAITVVNSYATFFNHKQLWLSNNEALNRFYRLKFDMAFFEKSGKTINENTLLAFKKEYQDILDELNRNWVHSRGSSKHQA